MRNYWSLKLPLLRKGVRQKREIFVRLRFLQEASIGLELGRHHILNCCWPTQGWSHNEYIFWGSMEDHHWQVASPPLPAMFHIGSEVTLAVDDISS